MIDSPLCSSTAKRSSSLINQSRLQNQNNNNNNDQDRPFPPPPPPSFFNDNPLSSAEQRSTVRASGSGLTDGFVDDHCSYIRYSPT